MTGMFGHWPNRKPMRTFRSYLFGPLSGLGLAAALAACLADQALKLWLLFSFGLAQRGVVALAPVLDRLNQEIDLGSPDHGACGSFGRPRGGGVQKDVAGLVRQPDWLVRSPDRCGNRVG